MSESFGTPPPLIDDEAATTNVCGVAWTLISYLELIDVIVDTRKAEKFGDEKATRGCQTLRR